MTQPAGSWDHPNRNQVAQHQGREDQNGLAHKTADIGRGRQMAISPRSPFRMRTTSSIEETKIFPSPILPVRAASAKVSTTLFTLGVGITISIFTLGRRSTLY